MFAVIMAGGRGERFWPWSRGTVPKQFLRLTGQGSMLQETARRLVPLVQPADLYVVTGAAFGPLVREQLPYLPPENIILEPVGKNTAPALGLAALFLARRDPEEVMLAIPADHHIGREDAFQRTLEYAAWLVRQTGAVGTIGIEPTRPETGYGYIERAEEPLLALASEATLRGVSIWPGAGPAGAGWRGLKEAAATQLDPMPAERAAATSKGPANEEGTSRGATGEGATGEEAKDERAAAPAGLIGGTINREDGADTGPGLGDLGWGNGATGPLAYPVLRFVEKPDLERARAYLASGRFYWNSGMFIWKVSTFLNLTRRFLPKLARSLERIGEALGTPWGDAVLQEEYASLESISVDYGIMERAEDVFVVPANFDWDDVGSWTFLDRILPKDENGNAVRGQFVGVEARNLVVQSKEKLVAALGVEDLIIVEADDSILICHKDRAQEVRRIVSELRERKMEGYL